MPKKGSQKRKKKILTRKFRSRLTVCFIFLSLCSFAFVRLSDTKDNEKNKHPESLKAQLSDTLSPIKQDANDGASYSRTRNVNITAGSGYVRFRVQLCDSDGVSFDKKLEDKRAEIDDYKKIGSDDIASANAFEEATFLADNEYNQLAAKAELALNTLYICNSPDSIEPERSYSSAEISDLVNKGEIVALADDNNFTQVYSDDAPFERYFIYNKELSKGDSCALYNNIIIPNDWNEELTYFDGYYRTDEGFDKASLYITNSELIADGFSIKVSVDVVDSFGFDSPVEAFSVTEVKNGKS